MVTILMIEYAGHPGTEKGNAQTNSPAMGTNGSWANRAKSMPQFRLSA
jgi:hypothetical protein